MCPCLGGRAGHMCLCIWKCVHMCVSVHVCPSVVMVCVCTNTFVYKCVQIEVCVSWCEDICGFNS